MSGVDWTIGHDQYQPLDCFAVMKLTADGYERAFGEDGKPFTCLDESAEGIPEPEFRS